ncbi:hypothetical protein IMG5_170900, partial [Ichthyophthirius multifiliis]
YFDFQNFKLKLNINNQQNEHFNYYFRKIKVKLNPKLKNTHLKAKILYKKYTQSIQQYKHQHQNQAILNVQKSPYQQFSSTYLQWFLFFTLKGIIYRYYFLQKTPQMQLFPLKIQKQNKYQPQNILHKQKFKPFIWIFKNMFNYLNFIKYNLVQKNKFKLNLQQVHSYPIYMRHLDIFQHKQIIHYSQYFLFFIPKKVNYFNKSYQHLFLFRFSNQFHSNLIPFQSLLIKDFIKSNYLYYFLFQIIFYSIIYFYLKSLFFHYLQYLV